MASIARKRFGVKPELKWIPPGPELVTAMGGNPKTGDCRCPLPGHKNNDAKPSLHVDLNKTTRNGEAVVHCWVCGNDRKDELIATLRERFGRPRDRVEPVARKKYRAEPERPERKDTFPGAEALWVAAKIRSEQPVVSKGAQDYLDPGGREARRPRRGREDRA